MGLIHFTAVHLGTVLFSDCQIKFICKFFLEVTSYKKCKFYILFFLFRYPLY